MHACPSRKALSPIAIAVVAALAAAPAARAQESGTTAGGLEEIIVTAQKREQSMMDVPVAVSAITGESVNFSLRRIQSAIDSANSVGPDAAFSAADCKSVRMLSRNSRTPSTTTVRLAALMSFLRGWVSSSSFTDGIRRNTLDIEGPARRR